MAAMVMANWRYKLIKLPTFNYATPFGNRYVIVVVHA